MAAIVVCLANGVHMCDSREKQKKTSNGCATGCIRCLFSKLSKSSASGQEETQESENQIYHVR